MNDTAAILRELIRQELQLSWSHIEDGNNDFALHHLGVAAEKVEQIKQLTPPQPPARILPENEIIIP